MSAKVSSLGHIAKQKSVKKPLKPSRTKVEPPTKVVDNQRVKDRFTFLRRFKNDDYEDGLRTLPFRSCLIHDNSAASIKVFREVKTSPKWISNLYRERVDVDTGEVLLAEVYDTNEIKSSNARKIKRLDAFCGHFHPLYQSRHVTLLFYTLTKANEARTDISGVLDALKKRFKRRQIGFYGYLWTAEVSEKMHFHYHICVAIDRLDFKGERLPAWLKLQDVWGRRTGVEFVKRNVRHYMAKYFAKHNARVVGLRSFGSHIYKPTSKTPKKAK